MTVKLYAYLASMRYALSVTKSIIIAIQPTHSKDESECSKKNLRNANDMQDSRRLWKADNGSCL